MSRDKEKKQIGKGIRALLSDVDKSQTEERESVVKEISSKIAMIPVDQIEINPHQPRKEFEEEQLDALAESIKVHGLIQPITVRHMGGDAYQLISGERRWRAARRSGLEELPAYIRLADDQQMLEMALVENIQREDLNPVEIAITFQRLMEECDLTHEALSKRVGKNRSTVTNYVRLLKLPPEIQQAVKGEKISMGHARALAGIKDLSLQLTLFRKTVDKGLSVRALERKINQYQSPSKKSSGQGSKEIDPELMRIRNHLREETGSRVSVKQQNNGKGKIVFHFDDKDELNRILDWMDY